MGLKESGSGKALKIHGYKGNGPDETHGRDVTVATNGRSSIEV